MRTGLYFCAGDALWGKTMQGKLTQSDAEGDVFQPAHTSPANRASISQQQPHSSTTFPGAAVMVTAVICVAARRLLLLGREREEAIQFKQWNRPMNLLSRMWSNDEGQDLIEYALMLTLILLVSVAAIQGIGTQVSNIFTSVNNSLTT